MVIVTATLLRHQKVVLAHPAVLEVEEVYLEMEDAVEMADLALPASLAGQEGKVEQGDSAEMEVLAEMEVPAGRVPLMVLGALTDRHGLVHQLVSS